MVWLEVWSSTALHLSGLDSRASACPAVLGKRRLPGPIFSQGPSNASSPAFHHLSRSSMSVILSLQNSLIWAYATWFDVIINTQPVESPIWLRRQHGLLLWTFAGATQPATPSSRTKSKLLTCNGNSDSFCRWGRLFVTSWRKWTSTLSLRSSGGPLLLSSSYGSCQKVNLYNPLSSPFFTVLPYLWSSQLPPYLSVRYINDRFRPRS